MDKQRTCDRNESVVKSDNRAIRLILPLLLVGWCGWCAYWWLRADESSADFPKVLPQFSSLGVVFGILSTLLVLYWLVTAYCVFSSKRYANNLTLLGFGLTAGLHCALIMTYSVASFYPAVVADEMLLYDSNGFWMITFLGWLVGLVYFYYTGYNKENGKKAFEVGVSSVVVLTGLLAPVMSNWGGISLWDTVMAICAGKEEVFYFPYMWIAGLIGLFTVISGICYLAGVVKEHRGICLKSAIFLCIAVLVVLLLFSRPTTFLVQISLSDYFGQNGRLACGFWIPFFGAIVGLVHSVLAERGYHFGK